MPPRADDGMDLVTSVTGLTRRQVNKFVRDGVFPAPFDGRYNAQAIATAYIAYMQDQYLPRYGTQEDVARRMGVSTSMVNHLVKQGMPMVRRGKYDIEECIQWNMERYRKKSEGKELSTIEEEKLITARIDRKMKEVQLSRLLREFVPRDEVEAGWLQVSAMSVQALESLAGRLGHTLTEEQRLVVKNETRNQRRLFAETLRGLAMELRHGDVGDDGTGVASAA